MKEMISVTSALEFAEWICSKYIRMHATWIGKYSNQFNKDAYKTTEQLYKFWDETFNKNNIDSADTSKNSNSTPADLPRGEFLDTPENGNT